MLSLLFLLAFPATLCAITSEQAFLQLAQTLKNEGNLQEAITHYKNTLQKNPHNIAALSDIALIFFNQNDTAQAADSFEKLSQADPHNFEAAYNAGSCNLVLGNVDKAIVCFEKALLINPNEIKAHLNKGIAYKKKGNHSEAIKAFEKVVQLAPDDFDAHQNLASTYRDLYQLEQALAAYDKALELKPNNFQLLFEKANMLTQHAHTDEAIKIYSALLALAPQNLTLISNIAFAHKKQGDCALSIEYYKKVLAAQPANTKAHMSIAYAYLTLGDFENGFKELALSNSNNTSPRLLKSIDQINGKTIFIPAQWCLEDLIQFIRYAKVLKDHGGTVRIQVNSSLVSLLKECKYIDTVIPEGQDIGHFDYYIPLTSLPALFQATAHNVIKEIPYLSVPSHVDDLWHSKLRHNNAIRIGIYFSENDYNLSNAENKSIPLKCFAPFAELQDMSLYSLQQIGAEQLADLPYNLMINTFGSGFNHSASSLVHVAGVIQNLDLVITRDSIIAHIAGALGRPVFVALPYVAEWRWMQDRKDSPWYPTMRLFRQKKAGDWNSVIEEMITTFTVKGIAKRIEKSITL